jgi:DNA-binding transcriptional LysR family regulator
LESEVVYYNTRGSNDMDLHYLKIFNSLAQEQSFTKAAASLHISQPAISVQIRKLEEGLGIQLFDRVGNKVVLNENGRILFETTRKVFAILEETEHELLNKKDYISGTVSIGGSNTPGTYLLPRIIGEFQRLYPHININLHIGNTDEIATLIMNGQMDFAVNGGNQNYNSSVSIKKLMEDRIIFAVSPDSPLAGAEICDLNDLEHINFVAHESNSQMNKLVEGIIAEMNIPSKISMTFGSIDAVKQAVAAGLGASPITLSSVALELELGLLAEFKIKGKEWFYPYSLVYNKSKYLTPAVRKLMDMVCTSLGQKGR